MAKENNPNDDRQDAFVEPDKTEPPQPQDQKDQSVLDEILKQTQQSAPGDRFFQILVKFCSIHPDRYEMNQELMSDIVDMILKHHFPNQKIPAGCGEWIAEILYFDAAARERVESVWKAALDQAS